MRAVDALLIAWCAVGIVICLTCDVEQVLINPKTYHMPEGFFPWPPKAMVQALHAFGAESDALLMARPVWFRAGVWLEIFVQLPFYVSAIYAVLNKREWIRPYCLVYSVNLLTIMVMILAEELLGELRSPNVPMMLAAYSPWAIAPMLILARVCTPGPLFPDAAGGSKQGGKAGKRA